MRALYPHEIAQIAGRAGRHIENGTFGTTGEALSLGFRHTRDSIIDMCLMDGGDVVSEIERKLGFAPASAADSSQPAGRRPARPAAGPVPVVVVTVL